MTANFLDDFKSVWIFPDANGNPRANAAYFVWQSNFCLGGGGNQNSTKKIAQNTGVFGPKTPS